MQVIFFSLWWNLEFCSYGRVLSAVLERSPDLGACGKWGVMWDQGFREVSGAGDSKQLHSSSRCRASRGAFLPHVGSLEPASTEINTPHLSVSQRYILNISNMQFSQILQPSYLPQTILWGGKASHSSGENSIFFFWACSTILWTQCSPLP